MNFFLTHFALTMLGGGASSSDASSDAAPMVFFPTHLVMSICGGGASQSDSLGGAATITMSCGAADVTVPMALSGSASVGMACSSATISGTGSARKVVFAHHSTGAQLLADARGGLGSDLNDAEYFVSDTYYEWDATSNTNIGDNTDIGHWYSWFADTTDQSGTPRRDRIMGSLYTEYTKSTPGQAAYGSYTRTVSDPGGENEIVIIKSCFPNSDIYDDNTTVPSDLYGRAYDYTVGSVNAHTLSNCKAVYGQLLAYMKAHTGKLFIIITQPPRLSTSTTSGRAANARALCDWLRDEWLQDESWAGKNVRVFDYFNVLTDPDNHHRIESSVEVHHTEPDSSNYTYYPYSSSDDHPSNTGHQKAAAEFVPLLDLWLSAFDAWDPSAMSGTATITMSCGAADVTVPMALSGSASIATACSDASVSSETDISGTATITMSCGAADVTVPMALSGSASVGMACSSATIVDLTSDELHGSASVTMECAAADVEMPIALSGASSISMEASGEVSMLSPLTGSASIGTSCGDAEVSLALALTGSAPASVEATGMIAVAFAVSGGAAFVLVCSSAFLDTGAFEDGIERAWRFRAQTGSWVFTSQIGTWRFVA
jgi:hypothetical protein